MRPVAGECESFKNIMKIIFNRKAPDHEVQPNILCRSTLSSLTHDDSIQVHFTRNKEPSHDISWFLSSSHRSKDCIRYRNSNLEYVRSDFLTRVIWLAFNQIIFLETGTQGTLQGIRGIKWFPNSETDRKPEGIFMQPKYQTRGTILKSMGFYFFNSSLVLISLFTTVILNTQLIRCRS